MPGFAEIAGALFGVWRLVHGDPRAVVYFNTSVAGAWRSFFAAVLIAPLYAVLIALRYPDIAAEVTPLRYVTVETIAYVTSWVLYPVVVEALSRRIDRRERFPGYLCIYNWSMVVQNGAILLLAILATLDLLPAQLGDLIGLVVFVVLMVFLGFIARVGLGVSGMTATGLVVLDVLLSVLISGTAQSLY